MSPEEKKEHDEEYASLLALFVSLLGVLNTDDESEALYALSEKRADYAIKHVLKGLGVSVEKALELLKNRGDSNLTKHDMDLRDRIQAAVENLADFSVCEEYQLYDEAKEVAGLSGVDFDSEDYEDLLDLCKKYNDTYAAVENSDIAYAGTMAAWWINLGIADYLVYWTQNDARVRPWHMALQGYAAHPDEFPSWMIPPIEWHCRCFLTTLDSPILGDAKLPETVKSRRIKNALEIKKPAEIDDVFSESLAKCGRIFGPTHTYFAVKETDRDMLKGFTERIKGKYYGKKV